MHIDRGRGIWTTGSFWGGVICNNMFALGGESMFV